MIFASADPRPAPPEPAGEAAITVVIPTFNERGNIAGQIAKVREALAGREWRIIVVDDDSPDGTAEAVKALALEEPRLECLRRVGRRGLAGAVIEGALASVTPLVAVIDADLQHDAMLLPRMADALADPAVDLVVGSRYAEGGEGRDGLSSTRRRGSRLASWLASVVLGGELSDPVSGFFMARRAVVERVAHRLSPRGFKVLFDLVASQDQRIGIVEIPYAFAARTAGESKLDAGVVADYLALLIAKLTGGLVPQRAVLFGLVGASGVIVNLAALRLALAGRTPFIIAEAAAALLAMVSNFLINNAVTYRDRRLAGGALLGGFARFAALCGVGLVINVAVADLAHHLGAVWWLAALLGVALGAAWNYVSTAVGVWRT